MTRRTTFLAAILTVGAASWIGCGTDAGNGPAEDPGAAAVGRRACASCHQSAGGLTLAGGDTPVAGTMAFATNLTPDPETGIGS